MLHRGSDERRQFPQRHTVAAPPGGMAVPVPPGAGGRVPQGDPLPGGPGPIVIAERHHRPADRRARSAPAPGPRRGGHLWPRSPADLPVRPRRRPGRAASGLGSTGAAPGGAPEHPGVPSVRHPRTDPRAVTAGGSVRRSRDGRGPARSGLGELRAGVRPARPGPDRPLSVLPRRPVQRGGAGGCPGFGPLEGPAGAQLPQQPDGLPPRRRPRCPPSSMWSPPTAGPWWRSPTMRTRATSTRPGATADRCTGICVRRPISIACCR